jgi:hypothetical protein
MNGSRQKAVGSKQRTEVGSGKRACAGPPRRAGRSEVGKLPLIAFALLATSYFLLPTSAIAGTHVAATYDLGANPRVMATVNGTPQYGLVFAQRNKRVTYGEVEYGPSVVKGYLNSSGQLNDGAGNLWLDLIPNLGATPGDSYYVVTFNIQGRVHAEIWVVPDVVSVAAEVCRQAQPPSSTAPALFYQFLQQAGDDLPQRQKLNFAGSGVSCVDNAGQLRTDCAFSGGGGGSVPKASATVSGTVKTDVTASDPAVYLQSSTDSLLAGKVSATRNVSTSSPLSGGGPLSADLTLSCPTCSVSGHSHAEGDVTNLVSDLAGKVPTSRTISTTAPLQGGGDLSANRTFYIDLFGTAPGTKVVSTSLGGDPATDNCVKWIAGGKLGDTGAACGSGGSGDNISVNGTAASDADFDNSTPAAPANAINVKWQKDSSTPNNVSAYVPYAAPLTLTGGNLTADSSVVRNNQANTYTAGNKQTFQNSATTAGLNLASSSDPSTPAQGDHWINTEALKWRGVSTTYSATPQSRNVSTSSPLGGGGALTSDLTLTCTTCEVTGNKNAASGYAGLTSGTKLTAAQGQEVWAVTDLTTYDGTSGTGSTALLATLTGLATGDLLKWSGTNWVNTASVAKADALTNDPTDCGANQYATGIAANGNLTCSQPATSNLSDGANVVKNNQTNTYSTGTQDFESASVTRPFRRLAYASFPGTCTANREFLERSDPGTAGQVLYVCNSGGNGWDLVGDGGGGGSSHAILSATHTDTDAATAVLGDLISGNATPHWQRVAGNTTATKKYLNQTGNGSISAVPVWDVIADADLPSSIARDSEISLANLAGGTAGANSYDFAGASVTRPLRRLAFGSFPGTCTALTDILARSDPATAGQALYLCNSSGNGWDLVGDGGGGGGVTSLDTLTGAVTMANGTTGTAPNWTHATTIDTLNIPLAATASVTAGLLSKSDYDVFNGKPSLVASGTAGVGPSKAGTATTAARSDHDHRSVHTLSWFFPGTPPTGVANLILTIPEGVTNIALLDMRVTAATYSSGSSTFNIQRCFTGGAACNATTSTWVNIYAANLTLAASTYTAVKGSAPDQNNTALVAGDRFRANLVTIGSSLADVTVTLTVKYETTN